MRQTNNSIHITPEQKERANQVDLVDYLRSKGYEFFRMGNSYKMKIKKPFPGDMSSVSIFENRKGWKRWSNGDHGGDAISFLQKNMNMTFQDAVLELTGGQTFTHYPSSSFEYKSANKPNTDDTEKAFKLPEKTDGKFSRLFAYLTKTRMIDAHIVNKMVADKKMYQDTRNNVVFVGYNEKNEASFACIRGTNTNTQFRGDCTGSDKRYAFSVEGTNPNKLYIFEAPIDLLSHATMANIYCNHEKAWTIHSRLCLAGTSDVALEHYLKSHPEVKELHFLLDNNKAGRDATENHCKKYSAMGFKVIDHCPKGNDVNADLVEMVSAKPPPKIGQPKMKLA